MGVMSCAIPYCENIMCDTAVPDIGYVCKECQKEFDEYLEENPIEATKRNIKNELTKFMKTDKGTYSGDKEMSTKDFFKSHTNTY